MAGILKAAGAALGKSGNAYLRYYRAKYDESSKHKHKRAVVLTARKLVRLVDAMLRRNQLYIPLPLNLTTEVSKQGSY